MGNILFKSLLCAFSPKKQIYSIIFFSFNLKFHYSIVLFISKCKFFLFVKWILSNYFAFNIYVLIILQLILIRNIQEYFQNLTYFDKIHESSWIFRFMYLMIALNLNDLTAFSHYESVFIIDMCVRFIGRWYFRIIDSNIFPFFYEMIKHIMCFLIAYALNNILKLFSVFFFWVDNIEF